MKFRNLGIILAVALMGSLPVLAQDNQETIQESIDRLKAQVAALQRLAEASDSRLGKVEGKSSAGVLTLGTASGLKLSGDLRIRYQQQRLNNDNPAEGQNYTVAEIVRERVRLGFDWSNNEDWTIGAGLSTGAAAATSTNSTYSTASAFSRNPVQLEYAYAKHTWALGDTKTSVTLGQMKNPYVSGWLLWDSDVRPVGVVVQEEVGPVFLTAGYHYVYETGGTNQDDALMGAVQVGVKGKTNVAQDDVVEGCVAAAYYGYNRETSLLQGVDYRFQIADLYADTKVTFGKVASVKVYGDYTQNIGATSDIGLPGVPPASNPSQVKDVADIDPRHSNDAILVGCDATVGRFMAGVAYARVMADSMYAPLKDADPGENLGGATGGVTDVEGWVYKVGVNLTTNMSVNGTMFDFRRLEGREVLNVNANQTYQLDFNYKF